MLDLLWINGENFRNTHQASLLYGLITPHLVNMRLYDPAVVGSDHGYEAPYGRAQFVFEHDTA